MAKKGPSVTLAEGESSQPIVEGPRRRAGEVTKDAALSGAGALLSIDPLRRAARWLFLVVGGGLWNRHRRDEDRKTGRQPHE